MSKSEIEISAENAQKLGDLIFRGALLEELQQSPWIADIQELQRILERLPAVDAVEVVRCRDCVHYEFGFCVRSILYSKGPNGYCENGERRSDE